LGKNPPLWRFCIRFVVLLFLFPKISAIKTLPERYAYFIHSLFILAKNFVLQLPPNLFAKIGVYFCACDFVRCPVGMDTLIVSRLKVISPDPKDGFGK
jgi:hypothetical protein